MILGIDFNSGLTSINENTDYTCKPITQNSTLELLHDTKHGLIIFLLNGKNVLEHKNEKFKKKNINRLTFSLQLNSLGAVINLMTPTEDEIHSKVKGDEFTFNYDRYRRDLEM